MPVFNKFTALTAMTFILSACSQAPDTSAPVKADYAQAMTQAMAGQSEKAAARNVYRHPAETIAFFGLTPGMKVAEALPGGSWDGSWYTRILSPYLGAQGHISGVDYAIEMWPLFGGFATPEFIETKKTWSETWTESVSGNAGADGASASAFTFSTAPKADAGTYDSVLFIRALHNLSRFEAEGGYMSDAVATAYELLKSGGTVGVVQHRAPETASAQWAKGQNGYVKQSDVIAAFERGGFKLAAKSEINANPKDTPGEEDFVWRLPPNLSGSKDDADLQAKMVAIGESDRMTLRFVKP